MAGNFGECMPDYMAWYSNVSCHFISPSIEQMSRKAPHEAPLANTNEVRFLVMPYVLFYGLVKLCNLC